MDGSQLSLSKSKQKNKPNGASSLQFRNDLDQKLFKKTKTKTDKKKTLYLETPLGAVEKSRGAGGGYRVTRPVYVT